ncbi:MAG: hypothetical protein ABIG90_02655 [bacterium]
MSNNIIKTIQSREKESEKKFLEAQGQTQELIKSSHEKAKQIIQKAQKLSKLEKQKIVEEIGQQTLKQIKKQDHDTKFELAKLKIDPAKREKAVNLIVSRILE